MLMMFAYGFLGAPISHGPLDRIMGTAFMLGIFSLYIAIIVKTTRNYFRKRKEAQYAPGNDENISDEV